MPRGRPVGSKDSYNRVRSKSKRTTGVRPITSFLRTVPGASRATNEDPSPTNENPVATDARDDEFVAVTPRNIVFEDNYSLADNNGESNKDSDDELSFVSAEEWDWDEESDGLSDAEDAEDEDEYTGSSSSPRMIYLSHLNTQMRVEFNEQNGTRGWLYAILKENNWTVPKSQAPAVRKKMGLTSFVESSYLPEVHIWLPEVRWGAMNAAYREKVDDAVRTYPTPQMPPRMPIVPRRNLTQGIVAVESSQSKQKVTRGPDKGKKKRRRRCGSCVRNAVGDEEARNCPGSAGSTKCPRFG